MTNLLSREPVVAGALSFVGVLIAACVVFGVNLTATQVTALNAVAAAAVGLVVLVRSKVTPVAG